MDRGAWRVTAHGVAKSQTQMGTHATKECFHIPCVLQRGSEYPRYLATKSQS